MDILFNFLGPKSFDELIRMNERFYFSYHNSKSYSFLCTSLFFLDNFDSSAFRTQYDTALCAIQMIYKWNKIQEDKRVLPFIQFDSVIDAYSTDLEIKLNNIIREVDDPFWDIYFPANYFGDRSSVRSLRIGLPSVIPNELPLPEVAFNKNICKPHDINSNEDFFLIHNTEHNLEVIKKHYNTPAHRF